jgi:hypothetical protein
VSGKPLYVTVRSKLIICDVNKHKKRYNRTQKQLSTADEKKFESKNMGPYLGTTPFVQSHALRSMTQYHYQRIHHYAMVATCHVFSFKLKNHTEELIHKL